MFVGNIPYDVTEEELANLFRQFGEVVRFRLVVDNVTGKGKGYGFCDYASPEGAEAAKRATNVVQINGRSLRVDSATQSAQSSSSGGYRQGSSHASSKQARDLDTALAQLTVGEVYDILVEVKAWVKKDPDGVRELLSQRPVLAQALLKMQTSMGMMQTAPPADSSFGAFSGVQSQSATASSSVPSLLPSSMPPHPSMVSQMPPQYNQPQYYTPQYGAPPPYMAQQPMLPGLAAPSPVPDQAQAYLQQILAMTEDQVVQLAPEQQAYIRSIRMQYMQPR